MTSRALRIAFSCIISIVFLGLAVRNVNWHEAAGALRSANYLYLIPLMAVAVWTLYMRAQRWRLLIKPIGTAPMRRLFAATNIGFMANMLLPLRLGEVVRPVLISRSEKLPVSGLLATVLLERIFDMFTILFLFGISMTLASVSERAKVWGVMLTTLAGAIGITLGLLRWQERRALLLIEMICGWLPERVGGALHRFALGFLQALEILSSPGDFLRVFGWSLYVWSGITLLNAIGLAAFHLPLQSAVIVTAIVAIAVSVPSAPGYIGAFQLGCVVALQVYGIPESRALAFSIVHHLAQFVATVGAGLYSLWSENLTLRDIESVEQEEAPNTGPLA